MRTFTILCHSISSYIYSLQCKLEKEDVFQGLSKQYDATDNKRFLRLNNVTFTYNFQNMHLLIFLMLKLNHFASP